MKLLTVVLILTSRLSHADSADYPIGPIRQLTPGSLCQKPSTFRYPERVPYCERNVPIELKQQVYGAYRRAGFQMRSRNREDYKLDHLIPLCAGGSNEPTNLWPQHISIFTITDPMEALGCEKLKQGRVKHQVLVSILLQAKTDLRKVPAVIQYLEKL